MIRAEDPDWLAGVQDHVAAAYRLDTDQCRRLTKGFVACNLVMDLTDFFRKVLNRQWLKSQTAAPFFAGDVTYQDIYDALTAALGEGPDDNPPLASSPPKPLAFYAAWFRGEAGAALHDPSCADNPWREINLRLGWEVVLKIVTGKTPGGAFATAKTVFDAILAPANLSPHVCKQRSPGVTSAFDKWWNTCSNELENVLRSDVWRPGPVPTREDLGRLFADQLDSAQLDDLFDLVRQKNNQLSLCVGQLNASVPGPHVPVGWISRTASRLLAAWEAGSGLRFDPPDCDYLRVVCDWMVRMGLGKRVANIRRLLTPPGLPVFVPAHHVPTITEEWADVEKAVRTRGLSPGWRRARPVQDLFFDPLQHLFGRWVVRARLYGL
jgi:hypothetical protein